MNYDWEEITGKLTKLLRVHNTPIGMKGFHSVEEMSQVPKLRRPKHIHMPCQIIGQAIQCGFTIGFTPEDIVNHNCGATVGVDEQDDEWREGQIFNGGWCADAQCASRHHHALTSVSRPWAGIVCSPLSSGRLKEPDVCFITAAPGQIFMLLSGYVRGDYAPIQFPFIGDSSCSMTWVKTMNTGEIGLALPCFAETRFAGFSKDEVNLTMTPAQLVKALEGVEALSKFGMRYPIPTYSAQTDAREGLGVSYEIKR